MSETRRTLLIILLLLALPLLFYVPVIRDGGFIWDDDDYVTENPVLVEEGGLKSMWFDRTSLPQYYPLVHTTFWIEYRLWGFDPRGYHLVNVFLHGLAAALLWGVLRRLEVRGALLAAALFAVHPVHVESVAWITERKNVLSAVFYLLALTTWLGMRPFDRGRVPWTVGDTFRHAAVIVLFLAALLSKTVTCTLPAVMLVLAWWKRGRFAWFDVATVPLFVLGIVFGVGTAQLEADHVQAATGLLPMERLALAGRIPWFYAAKLVWPHPLVFIYPKWDAAAGHVSAWLGLVTLLAVTVLLFRKREAWGRGPLAGVLLFVGTLFPALGFVDVFPFRYSWVADHFQYLASVPVLALIAAGLVRVVGARREMVILAVLVAIFGSLTWRQSRTYRDLESLWTATVAANPKAWMAHNNLAKIRLDQLAEARRSGDGAAAEELAGDARRLLEAAVREAPHAFDVRNNLGLLHLDRGDLDAAAREFEAANAACEREFGDPSAIALMNLGNVWLRRNDLRRAGACFERAHRLDSGLAMAHLKLAGVLMSVGQTADAERELGLLLERHPGYAPAEAMLRDLRRRR